MTQQDFLKFCQQFYPISNGQLFQDLWVLWVLGFDYAAQEKTGFFVDIGAAHPDYLSNTYLLEKFGWAGILVEPNPDQHSKIKSMRKAQLAPYAAWSKSDEQLTLNVTEDSSFSILTNIDASDMHHEKRAAFKPVTVQTKSLNDILAQHHAPKDIDFISLDIEGAEFEVLKTFDFSNHHVKLWAIEHNFTDSEKEIDQLMQSNGYERQFASLSRWDSWYAHRSLKRTSTSIEIQDRQLDFAQFMFEQDDDAFFGAVQNIDFSSISNSNARKWVAHFFETKQWVKAAYLAKETLKIHPDDKFINTQLLVAFFNLNDFDNFDSLYQSTFSDTPLDVLRLNYASLLMRHNKFEKALNLLEHPFRPVLQKPNFLRLTPYHHTWRIKMMIKAAMGLNSPHKIPFFLKLAEKDDQISPQDLADLTAFAEDLTV